MEKLNKNKIKKDTGLFSKLSPHELDTIYPFLTELHFKSHKVIVRQGKPSTGLYIIQSGEVCVSNRLFGNKLLVLATLKEGELFGEVGLIEGGPASATVSSIVPVKCFYLSSIYFDAMQVTLPSLSDTISREVVAILCKRVRYSKSQLKLPFEAIQYNQFTFKLAESKNLLKFHRTTEVFLEKHRILIQKVGLLPYFTEMELKTLFHYVDYVELDRRKILYHENDPTGECCYMVLYGSLQTVINYAGKMIKFGVVGPKEFVGHVEFFDGLPRMHTYIARESAILLRFNLRKLEDLRKMNNIAYFKVYKLIYNALGRMLRITANQLIRVSALL